jgi:hypothetical protein
LKGGLERAGGGGRRGGEGEEGEEGEGEGIMPNIKQWF